MTKTVYKFHNISQSKIHHTTNTS